MMPSPSAETVSAAPPPAGEKIYRAGTLQYSLRGLVVLFLWLLWGDFAFAFFEAVFGRFMPVYLKDLHASNTLIGVMTGSFAGVVNILFLPNISQWSDRYRGRLGRRIPFLYVVTPLTVLSLVAVGFAPEIAGWVHGHLLSRLAPEVALGTTVLGLLCFFVVSYHFFNMVLVNAYNWLLRDVVPQEVMARFLAWFRIVTMASSFVFLWYVFPHLKEYRREIFVGVGVFYTAVFLLMCRNVKEGEYPAPPPAAERPGFFAAFVLYFKDCLSVPLYRNFFIVNVLTITATGCSASFTTLFARETLGLTMADMGRIFAVGSAVWAFLYFPMGWLCDRFSPLRVMFVSCSGVVVANLLGALLIHDKHDLLVYTVLSAIPGVGAGLGAAAATMRLFPEKKFGQFYSGSNVFGCGALIFGNVLIGWLMDAGNSNYRLTFFWNAALFALLLVPLAKVYRGWLAHGGPDRYEAPLP